MRQNASYSRTFFSLLTFFLRFYSVFPERLVGNQLFDLEGTGASFISDANKWYASNLVPGAEKYSTCDNVYLLGGYKTLGLLASDYQEGEYYQRTYTSLPSHNMIIVSVIFYKIDSWDNYEDDHIEFEFDGVTIQQKWTLALNEDYEQELCGSPAGYKEYPNLKIVMIVPHTDLSVTMKVISGLNQDSEDESFGIRDINMVFVNIPTPTAAAMCEASDSPVPGAACPCFLYNQFKNSGGTCQSCDSSCATCDGPNSNNCLSCPNDKYLDDLNQCVSCSSPCATCQGSSTYRYCVACEAGYFLADDYTCLPDCDYPLIQSSPNGIDLCTSPCSNHVLPDRTCTSTCDSLLEEEIIGPYKLCKVPCDPDQVLYYTGACDSDCYLPFSLRDYGSYDVCDYICSANQYLYPDGTCQGTCNQPYKPTFIGGKRFCVPYCDSSQYFFPSTLGCLATCPSHYYAEESPKICKGCSDNYCLKCPTNAGQTCTQCQDNTILDVKDSSCKVCSSMKAEYLSAIGSTGHQYTLRLLPSSCLLDIQTVQAHLTGTDSTNQNFPPYSIKVKKTGSNSFVVNMTFEQSILKQTDFEFSLYYLSATAPVPKTFLPDPAIQKLAEYAPAMQTLITSATTSSMGGALAFGAMAMLWPLINFQQFIGYFKYINVDYPLQVELFYSLFSFADFSFIPNPLSPITDDLAEQILQSEDVELLQTYQPPKKFKKFEDTSFFIENGANALFTNLGLFLVLGLTRLIVIYYRGPIPFVRPLFFNLRWNGILRTFLENGIPLTLATLLQLRRLSFGNTYTALCGVLAIMSFLYIITMIKFMAIIITDRLRPPRNMREKRMITQNYGTLYESLSSENPLAKFYHFFIFLRGILLICLVVFVESYPLLQIIPLMMVNIVVIAFLFKYKLFDNTTLNIISKIREILILSGEFWIFLLCFEYKSEKYVQTFAWLIIASLGIAMLVELANIIVTQIRELSAQIRKLKFYVQLFIFNSYEKWKIKKYIKDEMKLTNVLTSPARSIERSRESYSMRRTLSISKVSLKL